MNGVEAVERMIELVRANDDISNHADGCPPEMVSAAEQQLGAEFPPSYRRLVEEFGTCDIGGQEFLGVYRTRAMGDRLLGSVSETLDARADYGLPPELIVVMYDGTGGMASLDVSQRDENGEAPVVVWGPGGTETLGPDFGSYALAVCERAVARRS